MRKYLLLFIILVISIKGFSQDFSNKGKDFWLCFPQHVPNSAANTATLSIFITSDKASSGTITMPNAAFLGTFNITANGIQEIQIPWNALIHISNGESSNEGITQILKKAIRIKTDAGKPAVVAYAQQWAGARSCATLLLPTNVLGKVYYTISFAQNGSNQGTFNARSQFQVIATKDNTVIRITPRKNGVVGTPFNITLPLAGDMIQYQSPDGAAASQDLTGTLIESIASGSGGCNPIAVFSGSSNITIGTSSPTCNGGSYDPLWQQNYPVSTWGKNFGLNIFGDYLNTGNPYRVLASENNTNIYVNGALVTTLNAGQIYPAAFTSNPGIVNASTFISADKPICVAQYAQAQGCAGNGNSVGDPDMIILNPIEQNISDITIFTSNRQAITKPWINVLMKTAGTGNFRINGAVPATVWQTFTPLPGYSYLRHLFPSGANSYRLSADSGFNAICYGFGNVESYGYSAGTNVKDLYQQIGVQTTYGIETTPSVCSSTPFRFKVSLPYCADSIKWNLTNLPGANGTPITNYTTCTPGVGGPDSTTQVNGKPIFWYSLPTLYSFGVVGTYPVTLTTYFPTTECGGTQDIDFDLQVSDPPAPSFTQVIPGCYLEQVQFLETTLQTPKPTYKWYWDFGDGNTSTTKNPLHTYAAPGTYTVRYASITTPGCLSDTIGHPITIPDVPSATISSTNSSVCLNATPAPTITFTGTAGLAPYEFSFTINGVAQVPIISNAAGTYTIVAPTNVAGPFVYSLVSVKNVGSTLCTQNITGQSVTININPLPTAAISAATTVCLNAAMPTVTFTGSGSTAPYTFNYTINGVAQAPVVSNAAGVATVTAPTTASGTFIYAITAITDASATLCSQSFNNVSTTVNVKVLPTASIAGATNVCLNAAMPVITFTGGAGTAPYTFNYTINGVAQAPLVSNAAGVATVTVPTTVAGPFTYVLTSVQEASANACIQPTITGQSVTINVNPLPVAAIAGATTVCLNSAMPTVTFTGSGSTAPYTFNYTINGVAQAPIVSNAAGVATVAAPTTASGTFIYAITAITDASATLCSQSFNNISTTVNVKVLPTASIAGATNVCLNAAMPVITFTGGAGTAPYTFNYTINGVAQAPIVSNAAGVATVTVPTTVAGPFTYVLTSVQEASANACIQPTITGQSVTINVNPLPVAAIAGATTVCLNAAMPTVTFTGSGSTAPYTFNYTINGVAQAPIVSNAAGVATITAPTNIANTFVYALTSVTDGSTTTCSQNQTASTSIVVLALPTINFTTTVPSCQTRLINFTDNSAANAGTVTNWVWNFGDPNATALNPNTSNNQNPSHTYSVSGNYTVSLTVTTSNGCSNAIAFTKVVTINDRPKAGFTVPEVCINDVAAVFMDTSKIATGTITGYKWDFGDASPATFTQNGTHLYTAVGAYTVTQIVTSALGCTDTTTNPIFINGANPVSNFSVNNVTTLCANDSISIVNLSTINQGSITKVEIYWDIVGAPAVIELDDFPAPNKVYKHKYPNFQTPLTRPYTIRFVAYSGSLCQNFIQKNITVNAAPKVQFTTMADVCYNAIPFQITQASEVGGVPGTAVYTGAGVSATGLFTPALAGIGTHTIKYTYSSTAAGCVDTISQVIKVLDTASAKFSFINPVCEGSAVTFKEESTAPAGVVLSNTVWNFGDGTAQENHAPGSTFTHAFPAWGNYVVTMYNTSVYGCKSTNKVQQVYVSPIPQAAFAFGQTSVCLPNASVSFINNSTIADATENAFTYLWNFGDPASGGLNTSLAKTPPPHIYSTTALYTVTLTVTSGNNCVKTTSNVVNFIHPQPKASFTYDKAEVCIGEDVLFRDLTNGLDGTVVKWNWNFGDGTTGNLPIIPHLYTSANTFDVSLFIVNSKGCNSDTLTQQFTVHPFPVVDAGPNRVVLQGGSITLEPIVTGNDLQYLWTPNTYLNNTAIANPTASNMQDDIRYTLVVTARGGCKAVDTMFVKVLKAPVIPNTFTPNNDGINDTWIIEYLNTYPNNRVQVFTRTGQLVFASRGYGKPWNGTLNGKPLAFDTYYYIIEPENGRKPITGYVTIVK